MESGIASVAEVVGIVYKLFSGIGDCVVGLLRVVECCRDDGGRWL